MVRGVSYLFCLDFLWDNSPQSVTLSLPSGLQKTEEKKRAGPARAARSLSLACAQTKNTFANIHLRGPAYTLAPFVSANPYVQACVFSRSGSAGELKGLYDRCLGKTTGG